MRLTPDGVLVGPALSSPAPVAPLFSSFPQYLFSSPFIELLCRHAPRLFLGLDYDGTLVPIAARPEEARPTPALLALLSQLAQTPSVQVAVVSGRALPDLCAALPVQGIVYIGGHGLEIRTTGGKTQHLIPAGAVTGILSGLWQDLESRLTGVPGLLLEDKRYALALHYRLARPEEAEWAVAQLLSAVQQYQEKGNILKVLHGKKVVEVLPAGVSKGKAVQTLLQREVKGTLSFYLGDDMTDEEAFQTLKGQALSILVADPPRRTAARYYLKNPDEVSCFLSRVLNLRRGT